MGSRGHTTGPIGQTTGTCPTKLPAGIPLRMPTAPTQHMPPTNAWRHTTCIAPATRVQDPAQRHCPRCQKGNSEPHLSSSWKHAYASPRCVCPAPCVAWRCRADYACCTSMTTTASAAACRVQIPHAPMMQCAVNTWSTRPRTRMTGIAAAVVSRTPAVSIADALHAFYRILHQPNSMACMQAAALPAGGAYRHSPCISTASRKKGSDPPGTHRPTSRSASRHPGSRVTHLHAAGIQLTRLRPRHLYQCPVAQDQSFPQTQVPLEHAHAFETTGGGRHGQ